MNVFEVNFDGIVGPTHHYGGLSAGNLASQSHQRQKSFPREAALQGLRKMKLVMDLGIPQAVLPPHERPSLSLLRQHGMTGTDREVIERAARERIDLLSVAYSASAMWTANAATVSPSLDTQDRRLHFTPANLITTAHRRSEARFTTRLFRKIFANTNHFVVHEPLPDCADWADEGAANHSRLCEQHDSPGIEFFVFGRDDDRPGPIRFPARQTRQACVEIVKNHLLDQNRVVLAQQTPQAIDAGVFHNDVIAVANESILLCHEHAYVDQQRVLEDLRERLPTIEIFEVRDEELSLVEAVETYLFNSQLVTQPDRTMRLIAPQDCERHPRAQAVLNRILSEVPSIQQVTFVDLRQSMQNGGGPACLRLRVVMSEEELGAIQGSVFLTPKLYDELVAWVNRHYRDECTVETLGDPKLMEEVRTALDELSQILQLGPIYPFQTVEQ